MSSVTGPEVVRTPDSIGQLPPEQSGVDPRRGLLSALLLSSGFCGISYEILYGRLVGDMIGDQFLVSAAVLLTFLLGIGIGSLTAHRLWPHLWLLELGIGIYGACFALGAEWLTEVLYADAFMIRSSLVPALLACVVLLALPAFLIGTSLPLFAAYAKRLDSGAGFSGAYALYNVGAAVTVLMIEFWLLRQFGIRGATIAIALINAVVAAVLITAFRDLRQRPVASEETGPTSIPRRWITALALASVGSAIFQLLMIKLAEPLFGPYRDTFALVLCVVLGGIALGSALVKTFEIRFEHVLIANLVGLMWLVGGFEYMAGLHASSYEAAASSYLTSVLEKLTMLALLMGLPATTFGALIPALMSSHVDIAKESGRLLFVSSMANVAGYLLMVLFLHQWFDYGILALIVGAFVTASFFFYRSTLDNLALVPIGLLFFSVPAWFYLWDEELLYLGHTAYVSKEDMEERRAKFEFPETIKGPQDVFAITWSEGRPHFYINGYISIDLDTPYEKVVGGMSAVYAPRPDKALVLGVGSGATAATVGELFDETDAVEINGTVLDNLHRMAQYNFDIEDNDRVNIIHDDAIRFVKASDEQYSLILNTVTTPLYFSSSKLYTSEFAEAVKARLTPDGIYTTWIDMRTGSTGVDITLKTLRNTFEHCALLYVRSAYFLLVCSDEPIRAHQPRIAADNALIGNYLWQHNIRPEWLAYALLIPDVDDIVGDHDVPLNTLDYPALEFEMSRLRGEGIDSLIARMAQNLNLPRLGAVLAPTMEWDTVHAIAHAHTMMDKGLLGNRLLQIARQQVPDLDEQWQAVHEPSYTKHSGTRNGLFLGGHVLMKQQEYKRAILVFAELLTIDAFHDDAYASIGACYEHMKQWELALDNYRSELEVDPDDVFANYSIGRVLIRMERFEEALAELDKAVEVNELPGVHYARGVAFESLDRTADAEQAYRRALTLDPDHADAKHGLEALLEGN